MKLSLAYHTITVSIHLLKESPDIFGFVSSFVTCWAIPRYCSCTAMSPCSWWSSWPVRGWTFCWKMMLTRSAWWWARGLSGRGACKYILKIIIMARCIIQWHARKSRWSGGSWIGESRGCCSIVACPPSVVTKNGLSMLVRSLVIMISGVGGGWCCHRRWGMCAGTGVLVGVPPS